MEANSPTDLIFERHYLHCLAHGSYIVASSDTHKAYVVDPRRDVDDYLVFCEQHGLSLDGVLLTHIHADFVSGHLELHRRTGATIYVGPDSGATFPHVEITEQLEITLSDTLTIKPMSTPGHTLGCVTWLVLDHSAGDRPIKALTGDTLFVGGAGRPDLVGTSGSTTVTAESMARLMYRSLYETLLSGLLPDDCGVYPAHGPGSPCGKMSATAKLSSTIGEERATNPFLQFADEEEAFVGFITAGLPLPPQYFTNCVNMNQAGGDDVELLSVPELKTRADLEAALLATVNVAPVILDLRPAEDFASGHIASSLNFPLGASGGESEPVPGEGNFGIWLGTLIAPMTRLVLVVPDTKRDESIRRLARVGFHDIVGIMIDVDFRTLVLCFGDDLGDDVSGEVLTVASVNRSEWPLLNQGNTIVDVRKQSEYSCAKNGHVDGAINIPLDDLTLDAGTALLSDLDRSRTYALYCRTGYRSAIAVSIFIRQGLKVVDIVGGYAEIQSL